MSLAQEGGKGNSQDDGKGEPHSGRYPAASKTISPDYSGRTEESIGRSPRNKLN